MGCLGIISFLAGQHSLADDGFTLLPVVVRKASTRGLTFGTIPSPSVLPGASNGCLCHAFVRSRSTPPPICLLYFPIFPGVANALSPCFLGWEGRPRSQWRLTIARWTANVTQDAWCSSLHHLWVGGVKARSGSPRHCKNSGGHASMPWDGCLGLLRSVLPQLPPMSGLPYEDSYPWPQWLPTFSPPHLGARRRQLNVPWLDLAHKIGLTYASGSALAPLWKLYWQGAWWPDYRSWGLSVSA